jgi:hypothetical protein
MIDKDKTPNHSKPALCESCQYCMAARGERMNEVVMFCWMLGSPEHPLKIPFKIVECSTYSKKGTQSLKEMEKVAHILNQSAHVGARDAGFK